MVDSPDTLPQTESRVPPRESYFQRAAAAAALRSDRKAPSMLPGLVSDQRGTLWPAGQRPVTLLGPKA